MTDTPSLPPPLSQQKHADHPISWKKTKAIPTAINTIQQTPTEHGQGSYSSPLKMPATETGKTSRRTTFRTRPKSPKNLQQPLAVALDVTQLDSLGFMEQLWLCLISTHASFIVYAAYLFQQILFSKKGLPSNRVKGPWYKAKFRMENRAQS